MKKTLPLLLLNLSLLVSCGVEDKLSEAIKGEEEKKSTEAASTGSSPSTSTSTSTTLPTYGSFTDLQNAMKNKSYNEGLSLDATYDRNFRTENNPIDSSFQFSFHFSTPWGNFGEDVNMGVINIFDVLSFSDTNQSISYTKTTEYGTFNKTATKLSMLQELNLQDGATVASGSFQATTQIYAPYLENYSQEEKNQLKFYQYAKSTFNSSKNETTYT